jgi:hypothetical protein
MTLADIRDVAIIVLAVMGLAAGTVLILVGFRLLVLLGIVADRLDLLTAAALQVLESAREAAGTATESARAIRGTADFVGDTVVSPVIGVAAAASAAGRFVGALVRPRGAARTGGQPDGTNQY